MRGAPQARRAGSGEGGVKYSVFSGGYIDEDLTDAALPPRDIDQRLRDELALLRRVCG
jgi:hypothetical protein